MPAEATGLLVGVSGGADSACLLWALAQLRASTAPIAWPIRAVHIDHGLQAASAALSNGAAALCRRLDIPLAIVRVSVDAAPGASLEAAARDARYRAFALEMREGECLLTAHHAQDQAETLLLQLLRGAGLKGLSAMPVCRLFGKGWHLRPWILTARQELCAFREANGIGAVEDPMNQDPRFDRAYLRESVWPRIEARWPGAAAALARSAQHFAEAQALLDDSAALTVERLRDGDALSVPGLRALPRREQINVVRHWLAAAAIAPPSARRLSEALRQVLTADADHLPAIAWGGFALRRYQHRLFVSQAIAPTLGGPLTWSPARDARLELGPGLGTLRWAPQSGGLDARRLPQTLEVRRRSGGESLKIGARAKTHSVQHLCQSMGVLPWMRDALPLLYAHDALIAIGDIWQDARWCVAEGEEGFGCVWENAPNLT